MSEQNLHDIEYLRQKAEISYEEAANLLQNNDNDLIRALMVLETQGRLYRQVQTPAVYEAPQQAPKEEEEEEEEDAQQSDSQCQWEKNAQQTADKAKGWLKKAMRQRLVIEHKKDNGTKETILSLNMPIVAVGAVVAPYLAVASVVAAAVTGCRVKVENDETDV